MTFDYDYFVIGAGSGGVRSSRIAAGHGARVAVAEEFYADSTLPEEASSTTPISRRTLANKLAAKLDQAMPSTS